MGRDGRVPNPYCGSGGRETEDGTIYIYIYIFIRTYLHTYIYIENE